MIENSPKNNLKFQDEVKSAVVGEKNIIYNYFYYREDVRDKLVESEETAVEEKLPCPYRGLFHFGPNDAEIFFGREVFVEKLFKATQIRNFVPLIGASGSGKSSVVLAGLVPKLEQEGNWKFTHFHPGSGNDPFYALAEALVPLYRSDLDSTDRMTQADKLAKSLSEEELSLAKVFSNIQRQHPNHKVLLIVDQFEELYTQYSDLNFRHRFLDCLLDSFQSCNSGASSSIVLVTTMRADFLTNALSYRPFADMLQNPDIKLSAMSREELTEVIEKPAEKLGITFEAGLVERILNDVEDEPGNLPLLEFALTELWKKRTGKQLTHNAYEAVGQVKKALANYAEQKYQALGEKEKKQARQIFIQLIRPGAGTEDTRRRANRDELGEENWDLVTRKYGLADSRLVVTGRNDTEQETVEVVHEALIQNWSKLRQWMKTDRDFRAWQERLRVAMHQWKKAEQDKGALLRGRLLLEAEDWLQKRSEELTAEQGFITASLEEKKKLDRQRKLTITLLISGLVGALGLAAFAGVGWWFATVAATNQRIKILADESQSLLELSGIREYSRYAEKPTTSLDSSATKENEEEAKKKSLFGEASLKAIKAGREMRYALGVQTETRFQVLELLRRVIATKEEPKSFTLSECDPMKRGLVSLTWTSDRKMIACVNYDGTVRLWDGTTGKKTNILQGETEWVDDVVFSPDSKTIASGTADGTVNLWERATDNKIRELKGHLSQVSGISFSPNGQTLAATNYDGTIIVWDLATGKKLKTLSVRSNSEISEAIRWIVFSPNGQFLASFGSVGRYRLLILWDIKTGDKIKTFRLEDSHHIDFQFSPDSQTIIYSARKDKDLVRRSVKFWNITKKREIKEIIVPGIPFFSPDGKTIAVIDAKDNSDLLSKGELSFNYSEGTVSVWDTSTGKKVKTLSNFPPGELAKISFSPDSSLIAVYAYDNRGGKNLGPVIGSKAKVTFWKRDGTRLKTIEQLGEIFQINFSPDSKKAAIASFGLPPNDGNHVMLNLWEVSTGKKLKTLIDELTKFTPKGMSVGLGTRFSPDGKIILAVHSSGIAKFFDSYTGTEINLANISPSPEIGQRTSKISGKNILTLRKDGSLRVRRATGEEFNVNRYDSILVSAAHISDNKTITTVNWHGKLQQRNLVTGQVLKEINLPFDEFASSIKFSPDGRHVAAARANYTVKIWNADTGKEINNFKENLKIFNEFNDWRRDEVFFSPNGQIIGVFRKPSYPKNDIENQGKLELWEVSSGNSLPISQEMTSGVEDISFHPQNNVLAALRPGNLIQLWNLSSGKLEKTIKPALDNVRRIQFSRDGKLLFAMTYREIKILSARSGREISSFKYPAGITNPSLDFSADGKTLILQSDNEFVFLNSNLESLLKRSCEITQDYLKNNPTVREEDKHICD